MQEMFILNGGYHILLLYIQQSFSLNNLNVIYQTTILNYISI
jgi:hypothetical protein